MIVSETTSLRPDDLDEELSEWLDENWDLSITVGSWWRRLSAAGFSQPTWPSGCGGRNLDHRGARIVTAALSARGTVAPPTGGIGAHLAGPTILRHGTPRQIHRYLPAIADGSESWCQLFSEPGTGSDLAGLGMKAERDGDEWVVTGQKVWNSSADVAARGLLITRTDPGRPKHHGITYFLIDMDQPGVQVRPLRQMNGTVSFCEVFFDEARVSDADRLGERDGGWAVVQTTLAAERSAISQRTAKGLTPVRSGLLAGNLERPCGEVIEEAVRRSHSPIAGNALPSSMMLSLARDRGRTDDPVVRQRLATYHSRLMVNRWTNARIAAARGRLTGADGPLGKLTIAQICQESRDLSFSLLGADALLADADGPMDGELVRLGLGSPGTRIGGGTDEIQRSVIGERALGLPREPGPAKETPYADLPRNG